MAHDYASTTDCILQNLTMTFGNPSAHCFANAPWRAFTWTCALLQETSTQPWGNLQEVVQESLDMAEQVDLQQLPGLHELWKQQLWLHSQTRAFHYRYAEIKDCGTQTQLDASQPVTHPSASITASHDTQPEWVTQAPDHTSDNTSPLAPRQLTYSDDTTVPRALGNDGDHIRQPQASNHRP